MVETASQQQQESAPAPESAFKTYLTENPDALTQLFKVVSSLYIDPPKESEVQT